MTGQILSFYKIKWSIIKCLFSISSLYLFLNLYFKHPTICVSILMSSCQIPSQKLDPASKISLTKIRKKEGYRSLTFWKICKWIFQYYPSPCHIYPLLVMHGIYRTILSYNTGLDLPIHNKRSTRKKDTRFISFRKQEKIFSIFSPKPQEW